MKTDFAWYLIVLSSIHSLASKAIYDPRWERPILEAKLIELSTDRLDVGSEVDKRLVLNRRDGAKRPTSFAYTERGVWNKSVFFRILHTSQDSCGSTRHIALEKKRSFDILSSAEASPTKILRPMRRLVVIDHETRICDDYKKYRWEVKLYEGNGSLRQFVGNPEPIITIMSFP